MVWRYWLHAWLLDNLSAIFNSENAVKVFENQECGSEVYDI